MRRTVVAALTVACGLAYACGGSGKEPTASIPSGPGTPTTPTTPTVTVDPGSVDITLSAADTSLGALIVNVSGGVVSTVQGAGFELQSVIAPDGQSAAIIVRGALRSGVVARMQLPDRGKLSSYSAQVSQAAARGTYAQVAASAAQVVLVKTP